jgi:putative tryptophan/tyrosine transport system substrate-binding protein
MKSNMPDRNETMRRRDIITLLGGGLVWPLNALAQESAIPVVGFLNSESPKPFTQLVATFRQGLNEQGYVAGRNVKVEELWAEGDENRLAALAREFVDRKVSLIAATGGIRSAQAAKQATSTIPVLFISGDNPVDIGLVSSFNRPGQNLTGVNFDTTHSTAKRLEILQELVPVGTRIAVLAGPGRFAPKADAKFYKEKQMITVQASRDDKLEDAFKAMVEQHAGALLVAPDPFYFIQRDRIAALAARYALPALYAGRQYVVAGGLASYGPSAVEAYRQIGIYAGRILNGAKPDDLPVVSPQKFELIINLKAAKALRLEISPWLIARANEIID